MNKSNLFVPLFLLLTLSAFLSGFALPVRANPSIITVPGNYPTIQAAVDAANLGDVVQVSAGTYFEHVIIKKTLTLTGAGKDVSIIDGGNAATVVWIEADNVVVSHFTVRNGGIEGVFLNSTNGVKLVDNILTSNRFYGLNLELSDNNAIVNNSVSLSRWALGLTRSSGNSIQCNTMSNSGEGISLFQSNANTIYRNNFVNNNVSATAVESLNNVWDNGAEGNYWSDYTGQDLNGDGIGDTPYTIDAITNSRDIYPLIEPWSLSRTFSIGTWDTTNYYINVVANSTVASLRYDQSLKQVSFNVTGPQATTSYCNVTIPKPILIGNPWTVLVGGANISATVTISQNSTHTFLSFVHSHSTLLVRIIGTSVPATPLKTNNIAVVGVNFTPAELHAGENVSITAIVKNEGNFTATFNVTAFYDSRAIDTLAVTSLPPGESQNLNFTWNTTGVNSGHYIIRARASTLVDETDTLDNTRNADGTVFVMNPLIHDIAVISVTPAPTQATIGQSIQITVVVKNEGDFAEDFSVSVYCNGTALGSAQIVSALNVSQTQELTFTWITEGMAQGTYVITAGASKVSGEIDHTDNTLASSENVTLTKPDSLFQSIMLVGAAVAISIVIVVYRLWRRRKVIAKPVSDNLDNS